MGNSKRFVKCTILLLLCLSSSLPFTEDKGGEYHPSRRSGKKQQLKRQQFSEWHKKPDREVKFLLKNDFISFAIAKNGQFTLGAEKGALVQEKLQCMDMIFGHPNEFGVDDIGTSFTSFRINGKDIKFHELSDRGRPQKNVDSVRVIRRFEGVEITQLVSFDLNPESGKSNRFRISYSVSNTSSAVRTVSARLLLDTWAGFNDGTPFRIPRYNSKQVMTGKMMIDKETEIPSANIDFWETYETKSSRLAIICFGKLVPEEGPSPDTVKFISWWNCFDKVYDIEVSKFNRVTGDSAIALYWTNHILKPGGFRKFETYYGIRIYNRKGINYPRAVDVNNNPFNITITKVNERNRKVKGRISVGELPEGVNLVGDKKRYKDYSIRENSENTVNFTFSVLPTVRSNFDIKLFLEQEDDSNQFTCRINNHLAAAPIVVDHIIDVDTAITAKFYDVNNEVTEGRFLVAELIDKQDEILEKIVLYDDGSHGDDSAEDRVYGNVFKLKPKEGDYRVQVKIVAREFQASQE